MTEYIPPGARSDGFYGIHRTIGESYMDKYCRHANAIDAVDLTRTLTESVSPRAQKDSARRTARSGTDEQTRTHTELPRGHTGERK